MAKTLKETLNGMNGGDIVAIGTKLGSGFMFIGPVNEAIEFVSNYLKQYYESMEAKHRMTIDRFSQVFETVREAEEEDFENLSKLFQWAGNIEEIRRSYDFEAKYLAEFTGIDERTVSGRYKREAGDMAIIITGREAGKCWFQHEFDEKYRVLGGGAQ